MKPIVEPIKANYWMERLVIDLINFSAYEEQNDGYGYLLTVIDAFSKFGWSFPISSKSAKNVANALSKLFYEHMAPSILHSNNATEFVASVIHQLAAKYNVTIVNGRPHHPQSQGKV